MVALQADRVLAAWVERVFPGARLRQVRAFGVDDAVLTGGATQKAVGYGDPLHLSVELADGGLKEFVFHTAHTDGFGHDRRADRAAGMLLAFDTLSGIPSHVKAVDVGAVTGDGSGLTSLAGHAEFYLVTEYEPGTLYADELRALRAPAQAPAALAHSVLLARYLADLHSVKLIDEARYARSIRDTVGSGEGIFGMLDGFALDVAGAPRSLLNKIEILAVGWRQRLKGKHHRLSRTHGDFHPFNIVFRPDQSLALLDASRGCVGDPADDVAALAINFIFFALERPSLWVSVYRPLWQRFFGSYLEASGDQELLTVIPLFLAWRGLVVANPKWYPGLSAASREQVLRFIEQSLSAPELDLDSADRLF